MELALVVVAAVLVAVVGALRIIAPRTKTRKDDKVLEVVEKAEPYAKDYLDLKK